MPTSCKSCRSMCYVVAASCRLVLECNKRLGTLQESNSECGINNGELWELESGCIGAGAVHGSRWRAAVGKQTDAPAGSQT